MHQPALKPTTANSRGTILLAEDEPALRALVGRVLTSAGFRVLAAPDGAEAALLWHRHAHEIDLILTDIVMPHLSGRGLVQQIMRVRPDVKVLYMSGFTADATMHLKVAANAINFIEKPFSPAALIARIREILAVPSAPLAP